MNYRMLKYAAFALTVLLASPTLCAQQFKIATLAPDGSSWMQSLRSAAERIEKRTDGAVRIRYYPGGVMGDAATLLRRMRLGQLHGGTFSVGELATVAPEANLYSMPFLFDGSAELDALRAEFDPQILQALERAGLVAPALADGGFAYLFSTHRIDGEDSIGSHLKVWIPEGDPMSLDVLKRLGASPVPLGLADVYTALQTGTVNTFAATLSGAVILQWYTRARYVLDLPVLVFVSTVVVDKRAFDRMTPEHQAVWREEFTTAIQALERQNRQDNAQARAALVEEGLEFVQPDPAAVAAWRSIANEVLNEQLASGRIRLPGVDALRERLAQLRNPAP